MKAYGITEGFELSDVSDALMKIIEDMM